MMETASWIGVIGAITAAIGAFVGVFVKSYLDIQRDHRKGEAECDDRETRGHEYVIDKLSERVTYLEKTLAEEVRGRIECEKSHALLRGRMEHTEREVEKLKSGKESKA